MLSENLPEYYLQLHYMCLIPRYVRRNIYCKDLNISRNLFGGGFRHEDYQGVLNNLKKHTLYFDNFMSSAIKPANNDSINYFWGMFDENDDETKSKYQHYV